MYDESPKKFDRIVAIFIQLQSRKVVKAQDLADRFGVSLRTIYRDIRSLESSGVPIYSQVGVGYSLVEGYRLPPVMFTREEAVSFIAAEKLVEHFTDTNIKKYFQSALFKIKAVLRDAQKGWIENIESKLLVVPIGNLFNQTIPDALEILFESIIEKRQVMLMYQSVESEHPSRRNIEPVGIFYEYNFWYVLAYCHLRKDYRQFRTDRIISIQRSSEAYSKIHRELEFYRQKPQQDNKSLVRVLVDKKVAHYLHFNRKYYGFTKEIKHPDQVEIFFECDYISNGMARWFMMFADCADILEPQELKQEVKELISKAKARINK